MLYDKGGHNNANESEEKRLIKQAINAGNNKNMTPLHAACLSGNTQMVDLLIRNGADMYKKLDVSITFRCINFVAKKIFANSLRCRKRSRSDLETSTS